MPKGKTIVFMVVVAVVAMAIVARVPPVRKVVFGQ